MAQYKSVIGTISIILIALLAYRLNIALQPFVDPPLTGKNCKSITGKYGMEDAIVYGNYLISVSYDRRVSFIPEKVGTHIPGEMVLIDVDKQQILSLAIQNLPKNYILKPHGMSLYKNQTLYVINHAVETGGENIEVLDVSVDKDNKVVLKYLRTLHFGMDYLNVFNSLTVVGDNDEFYITDFIPSAKQESEMFGNKHIVVETIHKIFNIKHCYVNYCKGSISLSSNNTFLKPNCTRIEAAAGISNNGIVYLPESNKLYVADTAAIVVRVYDVNQENRSILTQTKEIKLDYMPDNMHYDEVDRKIYVASLGPPFRAAKFFGHLKSTGNIDNTDAKWSCGGSSLDIDNDDKLKLEVMQNDFIIGSSNFIRFKDKFILSSFLDNRLVICDK